MRIDGSADAERAIDIATGYFSEWRATGAEERAAILRRAAEVMRRRRWELAAWEVFEVGKGWREADGDVRRSD